MSLPLVSIVVNNFNYAAFLRQSIESALAQTHSRSEVVVVDDASTDESRDIIRSFGGRILPVLQEENCGQAAALNVGFAASRGDIVIFLDADDYLYPSAAARVAAVWAPEIGTVQYRLHLVDRSGKEIELYPDPKISFDSGDVVPKLLATGRYTGNVMSGNAFARGTLRSILPIPAERFRISADGYLLTVAPFYGAVASIDEPLGAYRRHGTNLWLVAPSLARGFRREVLHDLDKYRILAERAAAFGFRAAPEPGLRDPRHLLARLGSLCLEPDEHPIPSDTRISLARRGARASWRAGLPWWQRTVVVTWFLCLGAFPPGLARRLFRWRFEPSSRPRWVGHVLEMLRRPAG
jgi:glycosyltransferase involved in cell wall biosynthesis